MRYTLIDEVPSVPAMAGSGSPPRPETQSVSLFTSRRLSPSGMSTAIKALDTELATPATQLQFSLGLEIPPISHGPNPDLTNTATRLTSASMGFSQCANHHSALIARKSKCVNDRFSFVERTKAQPRRGSVRNPVPARLAGGNFICCLGSLSGWTR